MYFCFFFCFFLRFILRFTILESSVQKPGWKDRHVPVEVCIFLQEPWGLILSCDWFTWSFDTWVAWLSRKCPMLRPPCRPTRRRCSCCVACWLRNSSSYTWMKLFLYAVNILMCILYPQCGPETLGGKKWFLPPPGHEQEKCVMLMMRQLLMKAPTYYCASNNGHVQHTKEDQHKDPTELCCFWRSRPRISVHMGQDFGSFEKKHCQDMLLSFSSGSSSKGIFFQWDGEPGSWFHRTKNICWWFRLGSRHSDAGLGLHSTQRVQTFRSLFARCSAISSACLVATVL